MEIANVQRHGLEQVAGHSDTPQNCCFIEENFEVSGLNLHRFNGHGRIAPNGPMDGTKMALNSEIFLDNSLKAVIKTRSKIYYKHKNYF